MTQTEKALQLIDLCARLPYNTKIAYCTPDSTEVVTLSLATIKIIEAIPIYTDCPISVKPYLRSMSSMTEEERNEYLSIKMQETERVALAEVYRPEAISEIMDWLNKHHFDYRGLIEKGLALEAPEGMY